MQRFPRQVVGGVSALTLVIGLARPAIAAPSDGPNVATSLMSRVSFSTPGTTAIRVPSATLFSHISFDQGTPPRARPKAFEYSEAYHTRDRIHHLASYAMLPLFAAQAFIGQKLYNNSADPSPSLKSWHGVMADAILGLFAVNSITGVWNWLEGRKDPNAGARRTIHAFLMLAADAGFVATAMTSPETHTAAGRVISDSGKRQHAWLAYASVSTATIGYLIMLFR